ncbi:MAG: phenylacetate--CoA ligase, partial [Candidatus Bathyarchaeia archaeon]
MEYWDPVIERMPEGELKELQIRKLKHVLNYITEYSSFYRKKFAEAGVDSKDVRSLNDLGKLPFTTKKDFRDNYPTGMFCVPSSQIIR